MDNNLYNKAKEFVLDAFAKAGLERDIVHAQSTAYFIKELKPEADETLLIAGLSHDIERAFNGDWKKGTDDPAMLKKHQNLSADEIGKFLLSAGADEKIINRVKRLVSQHEVGGDEDENILCDADCLAFLQDKALRVVTKAKEANNTKEAKRRINMVFSRIHTPKAKQIAQKWYDEAMKELSKKS